MDIVAGKKSSSNSFNVYVQFIWLSFSLSSALFEISWINALKDEWVALQLFLSGFSWFVHEVWAIITWVIWFLDLRITYSLDLSKFLKPQWRREMESLIFSWALPPKRWFHFVQLEKMRKACWASERINGKMRTLMPLNKRADKWREIDYCVQKIRLKVRCLNFFLPFLMNKVYLWFLSANCLNAGDL